MSSKAAPELHAVAAALAGEKDERWLGGAEALDLSAERRLVGLFVVDGLLASNRDTDQFEQVRRRLLWSRKWHEVQTADAAAAALREFLVRRPDMGRSR